MDIDSSLVFSPSLIAKWIMLLALIFQVKFKVSRLEELGLNMKDPSDYFLSNSIALRYDKFLKNGWVSYQV